MALYLSDALGWTFGFLQSESDTAVYLQYLLLVALVFFLLGLVHGRTERVRMTLFLSLIVAFTSGVLDFFILPGILCVVIGGEIGLSLLVALAASPVLIGILLVMGVVVGGLGGLIGNRLLRRRLRPDRVIQG